jgi:hypothetical protein
MCQTTGHHFDGFDKETLLLLTLPTIDSRLMQIFIL